MLGSSMCFNSAVPQGQLWPVLAVLATKTGNGGTDQDTNTIQEHKEGNEEVGFASAFWEVPYVQALQLSISSLKGAFNLQCKFEARRIKVPKNEYVFHLFMFFIFSCIFLELFRSQRSTSPRMVRWFASFLH